MSRPTFCHGEPDARALFDESETQLYIVQAMKSVTESEARKNWFGLLDEVLKGEVIAIERKGRRLILKLHEKKAVIPDYSGLIDFPDADDSDMWGWEWKGPGKLRYLPSRDPAGSRCPPR